MFHKKICPVTDLTQFVPDMSSIRPVTDSNLQNERNPSGYIILQIALAFPGLRRKKSPADAGP